MRQRLGWGRVDEAPTLFSSGPPVGSREELGAQYALYELGPVGARPVGMGMGTKSHGWSCGERPLRGRVVLGKGSWGLRLLTCAFPAVHLLQAAAGEGKAN